VTLVDVSRGGGGPLSNEGGGRCLHQPTRWPRPGPRAAEASMDDATASVPDVPAGTQEAGRPAQGPAGISTVEYAMIYQAEKPRLVRDLIQSGANWHDADDASQRALIALYEQWETVRNPRAWLRKVAFREFIGATGSNKFPLEGHDQLLPDPSDIESLLEQDTVLSAIRQLPQLQRQVFALHFDQLTTSEIAEILQISEAAARQNLARARVRLKELLGLTRRGLTAAQDGPALGLEGGI
jgi:RNA polymerase sigma factor (sigma-70 family)